MFYEKWMRGLCMAPEGAAGGAAPPDDPPGDPPKEPETDPPKEPDEKAALLAREAALAKREAEIAERLKGIPAKEELAAYRKWRDDQKTEAERLADAQKKAADKLAELDQREALLSAKLAAQAAGITGAYLDDAVELALLRSDEKNPVEAVLAELVAKNPAWAAIKTPGVSANPPKEGKEAKRKTPPLLI